MSIHDYLVSGHLQSKDFTDERRWHCHNHRLLVLETCFDFGGPSIHGTLKQGLQRFFTVAECHTDDACYTMRTYVADPNLDKQIVVKTEPDAIS